MMRDADVKKMKRTVWRHYREHGRHCLPWRHTQDPYKILISEVMLQQTQVSRVLQKYTVFLTQFPTVEHLARASLKDVLTLWSGLGYNRRAKFLHELATIIIKEHAGKLPKSIDSLRLLPGVGEYTAGAVCVFAHRHPVPLVETNIKTVFIHHLFQDAKVVHEMEIKKLAECLIEKKRPHEWHWALMDYGAHLKAEGVRTNPKNFGYKKQKAFKGSNREVRGALVRAVSQDGPMSLQKILTRTGFEKERVVLQLNALMREGMLKITRGKWSVPSD